MRSKLSAIIVALVATLAFNTPTQARDLVVGFGGYMETFYICCSNFIQSHNLLYAV